MKVYNIALGDIGKYEKFKYPAGELQVRLLQKEWEQVSSADLATVTARIRTAEDLIETCMLVSAVSAEPGDVGGGGGAAVGKTSPGAAGTKKPVVLILPYLPYARADRRFVEGDCFGLEIFANILNSLNVSIMTLDAHSDKSTALIRGLASLSPTALIEKAIRHNLETSGSKGLTLLFPDDGARKRYSTLAKELDLDVLHCMKVRDKVTGKLSRFSVPGKEEFKTANVLLIDDICDGGGTFLGIADGLKDYGFGLSLYVTHGIFSKGLEPLLKRFGTMYTTDSFQHGLESAQLISYPTFDLFEDAAMRTLLEKVRL